MREQNWYRCPICRKKLFPLRPDTVVKHLPYKCRVCCSAIEVNIDEPSAKSH